MKKRTILIMGIAMNVSAVADSGDTNLLGGPTLMTEDLVIGTGAFGGGVANDTFIVESQTGTKCFAVDRRAILGIHV